MVSSHFCVTQNGSRAITKSSPSPTGMAGCRTTQPRLAGRGDDASALGRAEQPAASSAAKDRETWLSLGPKNSGIADAFVSLAASSSSPVCCVLKVHPRQGRRRTVLRRGAPRPGPPAFRRSAPSPASRSRATSHQRWTSSNARANCTARNSSLRSAFRGRGCRAPCPLGMHQAMPRPFPRRRIARPRFCDARGNRTDAARLRSASRRESVRIVSLLRCDGAPCRQDKDRDIRAARDVLTRATRRNFTAAGGCRRDSRSC